MAQSLESRLLGLEENIVVQRMQAIGTFFEQQAEALTRQEGYRTKYAELEPEVRAAVDELIGADPAWFERYCRVLAPLTDDVLNLVVAHRVPPRLSVAVDTSDQDDDVLVYIPFGRSKLEHPVFEQSLGRLNSALSAYFAKAKADLDPVRGGEYHAAYLVPGAKKHVQGVIDALRAMSTPDLGIDVEDITGLAVMHTARPSLSVEDIKETYLVEDVAKRYGEPVEKVRRAIARLIDGKRLPARTLEQPGRPFYVHAGDLHLFDEIFIRAKQTPASNEYGLPALPPTRGVDDHRWSMKSLVERTSRDNYRTIESFLPHDVQSTLRARGEVTDSQLVDALSQKGFYHLSAVAVMLDVGSPTSVRQVISEYRGLKQDPVTLVTKGKGVYGGSFMRLEDVWKLVHGTKRSMTPKALATMLFAGGVTGKSGEVILPQEIFKEYQSCKGRAGYRRLRPDSNDRMPYVFVADLERRYR
ncbi:MAG: hypothetical protein ABIH41_06940 [Nanoarchaeota archaeon]